MWLQFSRIPSASSMALFSKRRQRTSVQAQGDASEERICWYLRFRGWRICARNWIGGNGEIDIVASRWRTLLIVEVRQRKNIETALTSVDHDKIKHVMSAAQSLIRLHRLERYKLRYDVFAVDAAGTVERRKNILKVGHIGS